MRENAARTVETSKLTGGISTHSHVLNATNQTIHIRNAELLDSGGTTRLTNTTIKGGYIVAAEDQANLEAGSTVIDARGCLLIPGLNDHHVHLISYAAALVSISCGPPDVFSEGDLVSTLCGQPGSHWLRGTGYHESVLAHMDRQWLDTWGPDRPVRIQHRSGRLWILNSRGMEIIEAAARHLARHERERLLSPDGRLYDVDELLGNLTRADPPPVGLASRQLAALGVTGINDMTPSNDAGTWDWFNDLQQHGELLQKVRMSGRPALSACQPTNSLFIGETKVHLHDSALPDFHEFVAIIIESHKMQRSVAVHCVTEVELVFTLSAFRTAGTLPGDRIEHGSVIPKALIEQLTELRLNVVTQPNFVYERGDAYLVDIPREEHAFLYRTASLIEAGVPTAFGTDLPFGNADPWVAMNAAVKRTTLKGNTLGQAECIAPESALNGFLGELASPSSIRTITAGASADCCLLDVPWHELRHDFSSRHVRMTIRDGEFIYARD